MGALSRLGRAQRFVAEFQTDFVARNSLPPGEKYTYNGSHLAVSEDAGNVVVLVHRFKSDRTGDELALEDEILFDPDSQDPDDLEEAEFHDRLGISAEEFQQRCNKAGLGQG